VAAAAEHGLIVLSCGVRGNVIRFMPALTISDELINEGLDILGICLVRLQSAIPGGRS
jgi:4-aminobutyrate aminotransferase/(S)-3-amino-2-methylpropionate transaminase